MCTHTWSWCHTGRQLASVAGRRRSTSSVWRTVWPCWRTRTKPSSRNSKPSKTCTATNQSRKVTKRLAGARQVPVCPHVQRLSTEPCIWMPLPLFYYFAFFLKTAEKSVKWLTRNIRKTHHVPLPTIWNRSSVPISLPWKGEAVLRTDVEETTTIQGPCGEVIEQTMNLFLSDATNRKHSSHWCLDILGNITSITSNRELLNSYHHYNRTFYSLISLRLLEHLERFPSCATFVIVSCSCFNICY